MPPAPGYESDFTTRTIARLSSVAVERLEQLVIESPGEAIGGGPGFLAELKADPGRVGLKTLLSEIEKLERVRAIGLPGDLFADASERHVAAWRARAAKLYPSDLRAAPASVRVTLLAALCWTRTAEITDGLVDLLIQLVHGIGARAENRVERELISDLRRVRGTEGILFRLAEAAIDHPDETVRAAVFPVVGEGTLRDLVREAKANDQAFRQRVRTVLRSSYSSHYRRMLPRLLGALEFRCSNTAYRPVMDALELLTRYRDTPGQDRFYPTSERVRVDGVVPRDWRAAVVDETGRVERIPYELCVLRALREAIRRREISVVGANRWRDPEDDLPSDFEANRDVHYASLRQPLDAGAFIADLQGRLTAALSCLDRGLAGGTTGGVRITSRRGEPWIVVPTLDALPEPQTLHALKQEVLRRWGHARSAGHAQARRRVHRVHQRVQLRRVAGDHQPHRAAPPAAVRALRARDEHGHQAHRRRRRRGRRDRSRTPPHPPALRQPCGARSPSSSTRRSTPAKPHCGARGQRARLTPRSSGRGPRT